MMEHNNKQIYLVRSDLNMRKGKVGAQCGHAAQKFLLDRMVVLKDMDSGIVSRTLNLSMDDPINIWLEGRFKKICLACPSEQEMDDLLAKANALGLPTTLVVDSGLTEFNGVPTKTVAVIGPADASIIDPITGHLKPY